MQLCCAEFRSWPYLRIDGIIRNYMVYTQTEVVTRIAYKEGDSKLYKFL